MRFRDKLRVARGRVFLSLLWILKLFCKAPALRQLYRGLLIGLIKRTGLFDREHYLASNPDVAQPGGVPPLRHYVSYGDREGRAPLPIFDPVYYRGQLRGRLKHLNALLHYAYLGRYLRLSPSPWFDVDFYLANNKDVFRSGQEPLLHYLKWGGLEGRSPGAQFDGGFYLRNNPDVVEARINPLLHYLLRGRLEGRATQPGRSVDAAEGGAAIPQPAMPSESSWSMLQPRAEVADARVDVIVPVYKGRLETLRCLHSALAAASDTAFELIVIDDAGPEPELAADLRRLAEQGLFTLLVNPANRGFVQTVNRGMRLHPERDVVLLNSDAEVYDGWLDRLRAAAQRHPRTATVTPLSNNATICSYPHFLHDNPYPLEVDYGELNRLTASINDGVEAEAPSGVGFCMYIRRDCLAAIGLFDEKAFGKGYGEENDFCQRAIRKGWRNVIVADVFVRHWGAASFQGEKAKRVQAALKVIGRRYPSYEKDVAEFIRRDPLQQARQRLDLARLRRMRRERNVLIICHNRGGGTERHVQEDLQRLTREGAGVYLLRPMRGQPADVLIAHPSAKSLPNIGAFPVAASAELHAVLATLGITEIHTHSLVDLTPDAPDHLIALAKALGARLEVNLHDYKVICPRINLVNGTGRYCGEPEPDQCNRCLLEQGSDFRTTNIQDWRAMHARALSAADQVLVPDEDVAERLNRYFPSVPFEVSPHEELDSLPTPVLQQLVQPKEKLRVVVIGAIGKIKGYDVLLACARDAQQRNLPLEFVLMGYSMDDQALKDAGVLVTGRYLEENAQSILIALAPDLVWLPSMWPETYSYTLSIALKAHAPVSAFDLGAIARRLRQLDRGEWLMALSLVDQPNAVNQIFLERVTSSRRA